MDRIANALVAAIGGTGLGLAPTNEGFGRVALNGDASYSIELTDTVLQIIGVPGQQSSTALPISIAPSETATEVAEQISDAIQALGISGVTTTVVGSQVILNGTLGISGTGALSVVAIRDRVGNLLQSNQADGTTQFTIILGNGFDYGDAPEPKYTSSQANGGPRHELSDNLRLGATVTPEANAIANDGDLDDGISITGVTYTGFEANFQVDVSADGGPFVLDYWVDWNGDGVFSDAEKGPRLASGGALSEGPNNLSVEVPTLGTAADGRSRYAVAGETFARFRLTREGINSPLGDAPNGEVEDFAFTIQVNPFQNRGPGGRWDVNRSGDVSPIDALQVINELNRRGVASIQLDPTNPPLSPPYLDVNGDGKVEAIDALAVINYIENVVLGRGSGEGEASSGGSTFVSAGVGVLASTATVFASPLGATSFTSRLSAEGEGGDFEQQRSEEASRISHSSGGRIGDSGSIFGPAATIALDEYLDSLVSERGGDQAAGDDAAAEDHSALDQIFGLLGS